MKWQAKARVHSFLDAIPFGGSILYGLQRHIVRSFPRQYNPTQIGYLDWHAQAIGNFAGGLDSATVFEFGAGWDMFYNIALYCYGCNKQIIVDLNRLAKIELINDQIRQLSDVDNPNFVRRPIGTLDRVEDLVRMGIDYRAPADARATGLPDSHVDVVMSTNTMEHIPFVELEAILREALRIIRPGGILTSRIDYTDHFYYADKSIGPYNFMFFSDAEFSRYNSPSHYQNRRRHSEYVALFEKIGFEILKAVSVVEFPECSLPDREELNDRFRKFDDADLAATGGYFCARKPQRA